MLHEIDSGMLRPYHAKDIAAEILERSELKPWLHFNLGWRRDQIDFSNADLLTPANSFQRWVSINSPKATLALLPPGEREEGVARATETLEDPVRFPSTLLAVTATG